VIISSISAPARAAGQAWLSPKDGPAPGPVRLVPESVPDQATHEPSSEAATLASGQLAGLPADDLIVTGIDPPPEPSYVGFGDSITTGFSVRGCKIDMRAKNGCGGVPTVAPYPELVGSTPDISDLDRVGVWGATLRDTVADLREGGRRSWPPQLSEVARAQHLVTGALGINDLHPGDWPHWLWLAGTGRGPDHAAEHLRAIAPDLDELFEVLAEVHARGARVVVTLYYNPYDGGPCLALPGTAEIIVSALDQELALRARRAGLDVADFSLAFRGHGAGSGDSWVFGTSCDLLSAVDAYLAAWNPFTLVIYGNPFKKARDDAAALLDPHPNDAGVSAMARAVRDVLA
jgi:lysophospholipase L1-like esterase